MKARTVDKAIASAVESEGRLLVPVDASPSCYGDRLREGAPTVGRRHHRRAAPTRVLLYLQAVPVLRVEKLDLSHSFGGRRRHRGGRRGGYGGSRCTCW